MIEQEFFKAFGIEKRWKYFVKHIGETYYCDKQGILENIGCFVDFKNAKVYKVVKHYPEITAEILLKLICIYNNFEYSANFSTNAKDTNKLKEHILIDMLGLIEDRFLLEKYREKLKAQVKALFEED